MKFNPLPKMFQGRNVSSGFFSVLILSLLAALFTLPLLRAQNADPAANAHASPIVGTWFVKIADAPFQYHMFSFHADGTMQQSNPDFGDAGTSDSSGLGIWVSDGGTLKGKFVETTADRTTNQFVSRGEISFVITVKGDTFTGTASANFFDVDGNLIRGPLTTPLEGHRVTLP